MKLRVGLVGLGNDWETRHRPALRALSDRFEVRAIYESVGLRGEQVAREFSAAHVNGFRSLAFREDVDAILLLARQWYGSLPILAACDAGKAVYCASGLDLDPVVALDIKQRVEATGVAFMAEFPCRQAPATLRLKELIATRLGTPRLLFCHRRKPAEDITDPRKHHVEPPRLLDLVELVDWCRYVVGTEPTSVFGMIHQKVAGVPDEEDYQMMSLDFSQSGPPGTGPVAQISCGRYVPAKWAEAVAFRPPAALQVACENGIAFIDLPSSLIWFDTAGRHQESLDSERPVGEQLLAQFHRAVTSLVRNTSSLEDAFRALTVVLQSQQSCVQGRRMIIPP